MKVILHQDVKNVGKKGDIVELADGFARNCIINKKLGVEATSKNINDAKLKKQHEEKIAAEILAEAQAQAEAMKEESITLTMKVGEGGRTFGSISSKEIAEACKKQLNRDIDKKKIVIKDQIKSLGNYIIDIKLHTKVTAQITVRVVEAK